MADGDDKTGGPHARELALLLSGLVLAPEEHVEAFREQRALTIGLDELMTLRSLLRSVGELMKRPDDPRWERLPAAIEALTGTAKTEPPARPFSEPPPNPETPDAKSLPPPALASVIAGLPPMTVVSYAAFCACCEAMPQRIAETHAKFGVIGNRASLDDAWKRKLDEDERLYALWNALTEQFRSWLTLHR